MLSENSRYMRTVHYQKDLERQHRSQGSRSSHSYRRVLPTVEWGRSWEVVDQMSCSCRLSREQSTNERVRWQVKSYIHCQEQTEDSKRVSISHRRKSLRRASQPEIESTKGPEVAEHEYQDSSVQSEPVWAKDRRERLERSLLKLQLRPSHMQSHHCSRVQSNNNGIVPRSLYRPNETVQYAR
jgi:hypothetical protein